MVGILNIVVGVVVVMILIEWMVRRRVTVKHVTTGQAPTIRGFWWGKFRVAYNLITKSSFTQSLFDTVSKDELEDVTIVFGVTGSPMVQIASPEGIRQVLSHQKADKLDIANAIENPHFGLILGESLLMQSGKKATSSRSIMNPAFKHKKLQNLVPLFQESADEMVSLLKANHQDGESVQMSSMMKNLTYDIIGSTAFGLNFHCLKSPSKEVTDLQTCFSGILQPLVFIFGKHVTKIPTEFQKRVREARENSTKLITDVINGRKKLTENSSEARENIDLLDLILEADSEGIFSTNELVQNTYLLFLAGQETSAGSMVTSLYFMGMLNL
jgi:cytochrome P450